VRHYGPFEFLEKIGPVASIIIHNVFHVSLLKKYALDPNHVIDWIVVQMEHKGDFQLEPVHILD
jgi:hypothetical protein